MKNNWYVITGGPSSGKTSLLELFESQGYCVIPEVARLVIDEGLANGKTVQEVRADEREFQDKIFARKLSVEATHDPTQLTLLDRGMHDSLAYYQSYGWEPNKAMEEGLTQARYQKIFLLDPLPVFDKDYARTEDANFANQLADLLYKAYAQYDMTPIRVPVMSLAERQAFILKHIDS